jgi:hypothetical protein
MSPVVMLEMTTVISSWVARRQLDEKPSTEIESPSYR